MYVFYIGYMWMVYKKLSFYGGYGVLNDSQIIKMLKMIVRFFCTKMVLKFCKIF